MYFPRGGISQMLIGRAVGSLVVRTSDSRPEGLGFMPNATKYPPSTHGFHAKIVEVEIGGVAIYRPFGKFRRANSYCHLYGAQGLGQRQAYFKTLSTMNFVVLILTTSDRADYGESLPEIELLTGADFYGQLFTGINKLECGLIACETYSGLLWDRKEDLLFCDTSHIDTAGERMFRRNVLSCIQKVFDLIGFTCPVTIVPKLLLQETWREKIGWDERLPMHAEKKMMQWLQDLSNLNIIKIPRCVIPIEFRGHYSMHTFCDASSSSYACVVYLRTEGKDGVNIQLLQAKSRVAPLRKTTVYRLELVLV
ncbi:integrase catalytic domain-containing protein [Trichonephila clavipes]|nr:integrase catalytic domain-containing protein [Trichonephila clavipes]